MIHAMTHASRRCFCSCFWFFVGLMDKINPNGSHFFPLSPPKEGSYKISRTNPWFSCDFSIFFHYLLAVQMTARNWGVFEYGELGLVSLKKKLENNHSWSPNEIFRFLRKETVEIGPSLRMPFQKRFVVSFSVPQNFGKKKGRENPKKA